MILSSSQEAGRDLWRIDAPFSLPISVLQKHGIEHSWAAMAHWMRGFASARDWRRALRAVDRKEPKRICDQASQTPMSPMNLRVFKQTWTVICEILLPLAESGVHIAPVHVTDSSAILSEGCPASVLRTRGERAKGYKGPSEAHRQRRKELCDLLGSWGIVVTARDKETAIRDTEGDVLDALLLLADTTSHVPPEEAEIEAWIW